MQLELLYKYVAQKRTQGRSYAIAPAWVLVYSWAPKENIYIMWPWQLIASKTLETWWQTVMAVENRLEEKWSLYFVHIYSDRLFTKK